MRVVHSTVGTWVHTVSTTFRQRHVHAIFQVKWCTSYQYYVVYSNAIPIWHITFLLHTSGVAGLGMWNWFVSSIHWYPHHHSHHWAHVQQPCQPTGLFFFFCFAPCLLVNALSFWIQSRTSVLHSTVGPDAPPHEADCIAPFPQFSMASSSVQDSCTWSWLGWHCSGWHSHLTSYRSQAAPMVPNSSPKATTQELPVWPTIIHVAS